MRIDLHTHSSVSDGTQPPRHLMESAAQAGLDVVALTDHDTTLGWEEAANAVSQTGVALVRGIEISTSRNGQSVHLLGYLVDPGHVALNAELEHARDSRLRRMDRMVERLADGGIDITIEDVHRHLEPGATMGRPHLADALVANGVVPDRHAAFRDYLDNDSPYYVSHYAVDPVRAVELVNAAGGLAVIAHPFTRSRGRMTTVDLIEELAAAGLAGLEVFHRDHGPEEVELALGLAARLGLLATGSSDYHGTGKVNRLGEFTTEAGVLAAMEERASLPVIRP